MPHTKPLIIAELALKRLLPPGDRAELLGDLRERGFRLADIVSVIPSAWIAHLRREWIAPVPKLASASPEAIRRRTEQLQYSRGFILVVGLSALSGWAMRFIAPDQHGLIIIVPGLLFALFVLLLVGLPDPEKYVSYFKPLLPSPFKEYRAALHMQTSRSILYFTVPTLMNDVLRGTGAPTWFVAPLRIVAILLFFYRFFRLSREMQNMHPPIKA